MKNFVPNYHGFEVRKEQIGGSTQYYRYTVRGHCKHCGSGVTGDLTDRPIQLLSENVSAVSQTEDPYIQIELICSENSNHNWYHSFRKDLREESSPDNPTDDDGLISDAGQGQPLPDDPTEEDKLIYKTALKESFPAVQRRKEQWGQVLSSLAGLFGVASVVSNSDALLNIERPWSIAIAAIYLLGVCILCASFWLIAPSDITIKRTLVVGFAQEFKNAMENAAESEARNVRRSMACTFVAIFFFTVAVGFTWFAPRK